MTIIMARRGTDTGPRPTRTFSSMLTGLVGLFALLIVRNAHGGESWPEKWPPTRIDYEAAIEWYDKALDAEAIQNRKGAMDAFMEAARLGLPPAQQALAERLRSTAPDEACFWASIAVKLSEQRPWERHGIRLRGWDVRDETAVRSLRDDLSKSLPYETSREIVRLAAETWVQRQDLLWMTESLHEAEVDKKDPWAKRQAEAIDYLFKFGIVGIACSRSGKLIDCPRSTDDLLPPMEREPCLWRLRKGGYSDPCSRMAAAGSRDAVPDEESSSASAPIAKQSSIIPPAFVARVTSFRQVEYKPASGIGGAVAASGSWGIIGAANESGPGWASGAVYLVDLSASTLTSRIRLEADHPTPEAYFGRSVALSGDVAIVGAPGAARGAISEGAAYVFRHRADGWRQEAKLVPQVDVNAPPKTTSGDGFGSSVSISGDRALIGAPNGGKDRQGIVYVFTRVDGAWQQASRLVVDEQHLHSFGRAVSITGTAAVIAGDGDWEEGQPIGSAYVFEESANGWTQTAKLRAADASGGDEYGASVSIAGNTIVIGAPTELGRRAGAVYVFMRSSGTWSLCERLRPEESTVADHFGSSVYVTDDHLVVGAAFDPARFHGFPAGAIRGPEIGSVFLFSRHGDRWSQVGKLTSGRPGDLFGEAVAIAGSTVVVGAPTDEVEGRDTGAAHLFRLK